jgi:hypothetical protein
MLRPIRYDVQLFINREKAEIKRSRKSMVFFLDALVRHNLLFLGAYDNIPPLYQSGVVYKPERGAENWQDIPTLLKNRFGDCEDLSCYRCAELQHMGIAARPYIKWRDTSDNAGGTTYHAVVHLPNGLVEDPSAALGMGGAPIIGKPVFVEPY